MLHTDPNSKALYISPREAAEILAVSRGCVLDLCHAGELEFIRVGLGKLKAPYRIKRSSFEAYIQRQEEKSNQQVEEHRGERLEQAAVAAVIAAPAPARSGTARSGGQGAKPRRGEKVVPFPMLKRFGYGG